MDDFLTKPVDSSRVDSLPRAHATEGTPSDAAPERDLISEADQAPDLDPGRLEELDALGERAILLVDRAVDNFVRGFPGTVLELRHALALRETDELRATAHRLRGSALNLGALRVAQIALAIELCEDAGLAGAPRMLDRLSEAGDAAADALREYQALRAAR